jgi:hypothetical protein
MPNLLTFAGVRCDIVPSVEPPDSTNTRKPREIKQIAALNAGEIVALCNDSTIWIHAGSGWQKLPEIPSEDNR